MRFVRALASVAAIIAALLAGCSSPETALDFGPTGEITTPPADELSRQILKDFDGRDFLLGRNDRQAEVSLSDWKPGRRIILPFWLGVNPLMAGFLRPKLGYLYVMSESLLVRKLGHNTYLIRAGSKLFKSDTVFKGNHVRYLGVGKMLPTVVRFTGTQVVIVPKDAPATGTVTEKVPILREVSMPMKIDELPLGYARFETQNPAIGAATP
jgi:hypothetical protein